MPSSLFSSLAPSYEDMLRTSDDVQLFTHGWLPDGPPRSCIVIVHGLGEHSGRYAHVAEHLVLQNHAVHTYDQRGCGRSEGRRAFVRSFDDYVDDLAAFLERIHQRHPDVPLFLFGHSMGGTVAALYGLEHDHPLTGLILSSPSVKVSDDIAQLLRKLSGLLGRFLPTLPTIHLDRTLLSRDPAVVQHAQEDPLNYHGRILARTGAELIHAAQRLQARMDTLTLPLLIIHGTDDQLTDPQGSVELYHRAGSDDKTLGLYPGLYHETFNEPEKDYVLEEISAWLDERT